MSKLLRDAGGRFLKELSYSPNTQFKKGIVGYWAGKKRPMGITSCHWKGGFPKCKDCRKKLTNYRHQGRCRPCYYKSQVGRKATIAQLKAFELGRLKGKIISNKWRKNISDSLKGRVFSEEHKRKISQKLKGIKKSDEHRKKLSEVRKKEAFLLGKKHFHNLGLLGAKSLGERNPTSIEKKVYQELKERGILFETQKLINGKFLVDAYIPSLNLIIEADGDYWHSLDRVIKKDRAENAYLTKCGYNLLRLTETEINNGGFRQRMEV